MGRTAEEDKKFKVRFEEYMPLLEGPGSNVTSETKILYPRRKKTGRLGGRLPIPVVLKIQKEGFPKVSPSHKGKSSLTPPMALRWDDHVAMINNKQPPKDAMPLFDNTPKSKEPLTLPESIIAEIENPDEHNTME